MTDQKDYSKLCVLCFLAFKTKELANWFCFLLTQGVEGHKVLRIKILSASFAPLRLK